MFPSTPTQPDDPVATCTVDAVGIGRHPQEIENAVYFACTAAVGNVAPDATTVAISLRIDERLRFEVRDDAGGVPPSGPNGWLTEPRDRLAAVGGELVVEAVAGDGTRVTGSVPLP